MKTVKDIVREVKKLAEEYPDARYHQPDQGCSNLHGIVEAGPDTPGCLIGQAVVNVGLPIPAGHDIAEAGGLLDELARREEIAVVVLDDNGEPVWSDEDASLIDWLTRVQREQDDNVAWGMAVDLT